MKNNTAITAILGTVCYAALFKAINYVPLEILRAYLSDNGQMVKLQVRRVEDTRVLTLTYSLVTTDGNGNLVPHLRDLSTLVELSKIVGCEEELCDLDELAGLVVMGNLLTKTIVRKEVDFRDGDVHYDEDGKPALVEKKKRIYAVDHFIACEEDY